MSQDSYHLTELFCNNNNIEPDKIYISNAYKDHSNEIFRTESRIKSNFKQFCSNKAFEIKLATAVTAVIFAAAFNGMLPIMTAFIAVTITYLVMNNLLQYDMNQYLNKLKKNDDHPKNQLMTYLVVTNALILASMALMMFAFMYASTVVFILTALVATLSLYMSFIYTMLKGQSNLAEISIRNAGIFKNHTMNHQNNFIKDFNP